MPRLLATLALAGLSLGCQEERRAVDHPTVVEPADAGAAAPGASRIAPLSSPAADLAVVGEAIRAAIGALADPDPAASVGEERIPPRGLHRSPEDHPMPGTSADAGTARLEALVDWLRHQEGVASVRIPGGRAEGVRAYTVWTSLPARVPIHVELWVVEGERRTRRACTLLVEFDERVRVRFVGFVTSLAH